MLTHYVRGEGVECVGHNGLLGVCFLNKRVHSLFMFDRLSVVIPAYNEEKRLPGTLEHTVRYLNDNVKEWELLVVEDGSTDNTAQVVETFAQRYPQVCLLSYPFNKGKGWAVKQGVLNARYEPVLFMDADNATPVSEVEKLFEFIDDYDIVVGVRDLSLIERVQPFHRRVAGKMFKLISNVIVPHGFRDTQCGFKLLKKREYAHFITIPGFSFDVELLYVAKKKGLRIKEVGVRWMDKAFSKVNPLRHSFIMLKELFEIRRRWG